VIGEVRVFVRALTVIKALPVIKALTVMKALTAMMVLTLAMAASSETSRAVAEDPIIGPNRGAIAFPSMDLRRIGLTATVQITEQRSPGYVPVRLVVTGIGAAPADKRLTFRFATHPKGESPPGNGLVINVPVTIAQGSRQTTVTRYLCRPLP